MKRWISPVLVGLILLTTVSLANAQPPRQRYRPASPTLSPWLNLFSRDTGPLDNYHTFVRPQLRLQDTLRQQNERVNQNTAGIQAIGQQVTQIEEYGNPIRPTGTGAGFMNLSHYYQSGQSSPAPSRSPARPVARPSSSSSRYTSSSLISSMTSGGGL